jgi:methionyl-tRNA formyltransferase
VAQTLLDGELVKIWGARAQPAPQAPTLVPGSVLALECGRLRVACGEGQLAIEQLQRAGRRVVSAADFAHARPVSGWRFG